MAGSGEDVIWSSAKGIQEQHLLELLESGTLSDTQVRCGNRTWKVHKAILCVRSEWFKKALTGKFKEAKEGIIKIKGFEENEVNCLLHYIYTGSINVSKNFTQPVGLYVSMSIWKLGDFFLLEDLCKLALDEADSTFRKASWSFVTMPTTESAKQSAASSIAKIVRALYNQERGDVCAAFKPIILAFVFCGLKILEKNETFHSLLSDQPIFAIDWAATLTDNLASTRPIESYEECANECVNPRSYYQVYPQHAKWVKGQEIEIFCTKCFPRQELEDWVGGGIKSA